MPAIQINDDAKYERALEILLGMGGMFRTRPTHVLVIGETQFQELVKAGVVKPNGPKESKRGNKKKQA